MPPLLLTNIGQLLTLRGAAGPRRGAAMRELGIMRDAAVLCDAGRIVAIGRTRHALRDPWLRRNRKRVVEVDCGGRVALPGFVDAHTHPVFAAPRLVDFEQRIAGATYAEIAELGGGIRSSMALVRKAPRAQLAEHVLDALRNMAAHGTTTVEAKSGYGLSTAAEIKSLEAIRDAARRWPGTVSPTLLAAHVVPPEYSSRRARYVELICREVIPLVARRRLAHACDIFCEGAAFTLRETEQIAAAARRRGFPLRVHVGQFTEEKLSPLLRYAPASLDHLDYVSDTDIRGLARSDTVGVLVPASNYFLGLDRYPQARKMIAAGAAVALATDFNPGTAPTLSMPFVLSLACTQMRIAPAEAITAATINAAHALQLGARKGSLEPGKDADIAIFDVRDWREIPYWVGENRCWLTVMGGCRD